MPHPHLPAYLPLPAPQSTQEGDRLPLDTRWGRAFGGTHQAIVDHLAASLVRGLEAAAAIARLEIQGATRDSPAPVAAQLHASATDRNTSDGLHRWAADPQSLCRRASRLDLAPGGYPLRGRWASPIGCSVSDQRLRRRMGIELGILIVLQVADRSRLFAVAMLPHKQAALFPGHLPQLPAVMATMRDSLEHALGDCLTPQASAAESYPLSKTERALIPLLLTGQSERQIAIASKRSHNTIHCHVRSIYRKLGVRSRKALCELMRPKAV